MHPLRALLLLAVVLGFARVSAAPAAAAVAPRESVWFTATEVAAGTWRIVDRGVVNCYLVIGRERAALIDTGYGFANLRDYVGALTSLPLTVINTHGHRDHCGGAAQFGAVLTHRAEFAAIEREATPEVRARNRRSLGDKAVPAGERFDYGAEARPLVLSPLADGDVIELGGRRLEVIATPGHTPGEIVLLDRGNRLLFAGDHLNRHVWLQLPGCLPLERYLASLEKLETHAGAFATILPGHNEPVDAGLLAELTACVRGILGGTIAAEPYRYGQIEGRIARHGRAEVVFDPRNLRAAEAR